MKPYIICHMMQSVDGRVDCDMVDKISGDEYYDALNTLNCPTKIEGRYSYQLHCCGFEDFQPSSTKPVWKEAFHIAKKCEGYEVSVDTNGVLKWDKADNENRLCILSEKVSEDYLTYLRNLGISYIATGKRIINLDRAMEILHDEFGVERVAVVGGGKINGGFLKAGLIDELSIMTAPGIDGRSGQPALFDGVDDKEDFQPVKLELDSVSPYPNGVVWTRYKVLK